MNREESIRFATKYLEDLLSFFGLNVAIDSTAEEDVIQLSVPSTSQNSLLIGRDSNNLRAFQRVISAALETHAAELTRVNIDIAGYKERRAEQIEHRAESWFAEVRRTGSPMTLDLNAADRRTVHRLAEDYSDIKTHSEGEGKDRKLIIEKVNLPEE